MRAIKFRGKSVDGKWFYGYYSFDSYGGVHCIDVIETLPELNQYSVMVDSETVGEYIGLIDKNGKEIYEGDWCRAMFRTKEGIQVIQGKIIMDEFMWCIECPKDCGDDTYSINRVHGLEVISNIYEQPELLKPN